MLLGDVSPQDFPREENPQRPEGIQQAAEFTPVLTSAPATAGGATGLSEEDNPFVDDPLEEPVAPQTTTPAVDDGQATPDVPAEDPFGLESDEEDPFGGF